MPGIVNPNPKAGQDCCNVVGVNKSSGVVTATEHASGKSFQFQVGNKALLSKLKPGMAFGIPAVSKDNRLSLSLPGVQDIRPDWGDDCCTIRAGSYVPQVTVGAVRRPADMGSTPSLGPEHAVTDKPKFAPQSSFGPGNSIALAPHVTLVIEDLRPVGAKVLEMRFSVINNSPQAVHLADFQLAQVVRHQDRYALQNIALLDLNNAKRYDMVTVSGIPQASAGKPDDGKINAGERKAFWAHFPRPAGDIEKVAVQLAGYPPLHNIPIGK